MRMRCLFVFMMFAAVAFCAEKYDGPRPPKPDLLYLVHADNLVPTETADAKDDSQRDKLARHLEQLKSLQAALAS